MKIKKEFEVWTPGDPGSAIAYSTDGKINRLRSSTTIKVPKKAIGFVSCHCVYNNIEIATLSFCSHHDEWDENFGKKVASERLYEIIEIIEDLEGAKKAKELILSNIVDKNVNDSKLGSVP